MAILSIAVNNLQSSISQVSSVSGLPNDAMEIQRSTVAKVKEIIEHVVQVKSLVGTMVGSSAPKLQQIKQECASGVDVSAISNQMSELGKSINSSSASITPLIEKIVSLNSDCTVDIAGLSNIENRLQAKSVQYSTRAQSLQSQVNAARKKYEALRIITGIFSLGLTEAFNAWKGLEDQLNGVQREIADLQRQSACMAQMKSNCGTLSLDMKGVVDNLSNIRNSIEFLANDVTEIVQDLASQSNREVAELMIAAAEKELNTLGEDAS